jgi:hypothetical protein
MTKQSRRRFSAGFKVQKSEALTTSGQAYTQKSKAHDHNNLRPARGGQLTLA